MNSAEWWNEELGNDPFKQLPKECPPPKSVISLWERSFPPFLKIDSKYLTDSKQYWTLIVDIIKEYIQNIEIPDPFTNFDSFVDLLLKFKYFINPISIRQVKAIIESHSKENINQFLVYELPVVIKHPVLYMNTIYDLMCKTDPIWVGLCNSKKYNRCFFDLYCSFLDKMDMNYSFSWTYKQKIAEILKILIIALPRDDPAYNENASIFLKNISQMSFSAPLDVEVSIIRVFFEIAKITTKKVSFSDMKSYYNNILNNISYDGFPVFFEYSLQHYKKANYISICNLHKALRNREIKSPYDFLLYYKIIKYEKCVDILSSIGKMMITYPNFIRVGLHYIRLIFTNNIKSSEAAKWGITFVRRLAIFPLLAEANDMYHERSLMFLEFLSDLLKTPIHPKISSQLLSSIAAVRDLGCPAYYSKFVSSNAMPDRLTKNEYESMMAKKKVKTLLEFYPFKENSYSFITLSSNPIGKHIIHREIKRESISFCSSLYKKEKSSKM